MALPTPAAFWPLTVTAGVNDKIDGFSDIAWVATIAAGTYYSPTDVAAAVKAALDAGDGTAGGDPYDVTIAAGRVTIGGRQGPFRLLFATGPNAAVSARDLLGFGAVDFGVPVAVTSVTAPHQHRNAWHPDQPIASDTGEIAAFLRSQNRSIGGRVKSVQFGSAVYDRGISFTHLPPYKVFKAEEGAEHVNEALERLIEDGWARFRWWPDATIEGTYIDYVLDIESAKRVLYDRLSPGCALYDYPLRFLKYQ